MLKITGSFNKPVLEKTTVATHLLIKTTIISQLLRKMIGSIRLIDLVLVVMVWITLRSQEN